MFRLGSWLMLALVAAGSAAAGEREDQYLDAVRRGDLAAVKAALDAGVPVDTKFRYDRTALSFACDRGQIEIVRLLLDRGADLKLRDTFYNSTALEWALNKNNVAIARLLIERGAEAGSDVLAAGVEKGSTELVALALENTKPSGDQLSSALVEAKRKSDAAVVAMLERSGARLPPPADYELDAAALASYTGRYRVEGTDFEVRLELGDGALVCANCGQDAVQLGALDAVTLRSKDDVWPRFVFAPKDGRVAGGEVDFGNGMRKLTRVGEAK